MKYIVILLSVIVIYILYKNMKLKKEINSLATASMNYINGTNNTAANTNASQVARSILTNLSTVKISDQSGFLTITS